MKALGLGILQLLALVVVAYAVLAYGFQPLGKFGLPEMGANFRAHALGIQLHVFAASIALLLGPLQFYQRLRGRWPRLHRITGRLYLGAGVAIGGLAGLYMATFAYGGLVAKLGFATLALAWLGSGFRAYRAIRAGDIATHRRWMVRNFALTLAAVTLRILLPVSGLSGIPFATAYPAIAWLCWVPNLLVAEWILARQMTPRFLSSSR
jgi:uncharacterized membrane protein